MGTFHSVGEPCKHSNEGKKLEQEKSHPSMGITGGFQSPMPTVVEKCGIIVVSMEFSLQMIKMFGN